jgi:hypothetical protein
MRPLTRHLLAAAATAASACGDPNLDGCGANWCAISPAAPTTANLSAVWGSSDRDVWMVGDAGTALHWDGLGFTVSATGTSVDLRGVWGSGASDVWVVGRTGGMSDSPSILHWDGVAWTAVPGTQGLQLNCVWGAGASDVWAGGDAGALVHWNGAAWTAVPSGTSKVLGAIWGASASDVTAVGDASAIQHWGGTSWSAATVIGGGAMKSLHSVWGVGGDGTVWAVGDDLNDRGVTFRRDPQHQDWASVASIGDSALFGIWGLTGNNVSRLAGNHAWAAGGGGKIFYFDGTAWSLQRDTSATSFSAVWGTNIALWAVGAAGAVFHTVATGPGMEAPGAP